MWSVHYSARPSTSWGWLDILKLLTVLGMWHWIKISEKITFGTNMFMLWIR